MVKVSVIVPVYNVEQYIEKCIHSLVNQTLYGVEVIIVNDGSPDHSDNIIKEYERLYKNIKYVVKENGGLSDARNYGLEYATGEYITFVDGDDYLESDGLEKMYNIAKAKDYDMVVSDIDYVYPKKITRVSSGVSEEKSLKENMLTMFPAVCNKIFKRSLFDTGIRFKKGIWFEDVEFLYRLLPYVNSIGVLNTSYYKYIQRDGSQTNVINRKLYDYIDNFNGIIDFYKEKNIYEEYKNELEYVYLRYVYATFVKRAAAYSKEDYGEAVDTAIKNVTEHFPDYKNNQYFKKSIKGLYLLMFNKKISNLIYLIYHRGVKNG
ncbi:MAG: glycosyltransferase family 2 protein [Bacilli bacterium]|nr:glycosyltransferase family 2 protein [Bacilli bacterium]